MPVRSSIMRAFSSPAMTASVLGLAFGLVLIRTLFPGAVDLSWVVAAFWLVAAHLALTLVALPRTWKASGLWLLHGATVLFCLSTAGIAVTRDLSVGLAVGASADRAFPRDDPGAESVALPFRLQLLSFQVERYEGSGEPSDYVSQIRLTSAGGTQDLTVKMNQPASAGGYTIYASSVEWFEGAASPVLKLRRDQGRWVPYALSLLLVGGLVLHLAVGRGLYAR